MASLVKKVNYGITISILSLVGLITSQATYDYIVVGSGPGGGTLAAELAKKGYPTLLIEAGPDHYFGNQTTPAFSSRSTEDPNIGLNFYVKHDSSSKSYFYPRAGAIGGCAIHNAMITVYPNQRDFNLMKEITGDKSWDEKEMRKYLIKMERNQYAPDKPQVHGYDGWLSSSQLNLDPSQLPLSNQTLAYVSQMVPQSSPDINGYDSSGELYTSSEGRYTMPSAINLDLGKRADFHEYLYSVAQSHPLTIQTNSLVSRVLFDSQKKAIGVVYLKEKYLYRASPKSPKEPSCRPQEIHYANKEVIISGGAFQTPQILMNSGVGPKAHLASLEIPVVADLPGVGSNLMDRYELPLVNEFKESFTGFEPCTFLPSAEADPCYDNYLKTNGKGFYATSGVLGAQFIKSNKGLSEPDVVVLDHLGDFHGYFEGFSQRLATSGNSSSRLILKAHAKNTGGTVRLKSTSSRDPPIINFNSFSDGRDDLEILIKTVQQEREKLKAIFSKGVNHVREIHPGSHIQSKADLESFIRKEAWGHHACCTAKIGKDRDNMAVLDSRFRVRGVKNLRVVDASSFPKIPGYFPTLYIHMMAMKVADYIAESH